MLLFRVIPSSSLITRKIAVTSFGHTVDNNGYLSYALCSIDRIISESGPKYMDYIIKSNVTIVLSTCYYYVNVCVYVGACLLCQGLELAAGTCTVQFQWHLIGELGCSQKQKVRDKFLLNYHILSYLTLYGVTKIAR